MSFLSIDRRRFAVSAAAMAVARSSRAGAAPMPTPAGKVILSISGKISATNAGGAAQYDRDMLESLGTTVFSTATPWYDGPVKFEGVSLDKLMRTVGASGETLIVKALNDYTTEIPIADFARYGTILALKRDGDYMPVKDKGPLFVVYNYDSEPELKHQRFYSRSAWQVARMIVD